MVNLACEPSKCIFVDQDLPGEQRSEQKSLLQSIAHSLLRPFGWTTQQRHGSAVDADVDSDVDPGTLSLIKIKLFDSTGLNITDLDLTTADAFKQNHTVSIQICDEEYSYLVHYNAPSVRILELPNHISSGFLLYPRMETDFCEDDECQLDWCRLSVKPTKHTKLTVLGGKLFSGKSEVAFKPCNVTRADSVNESDIVLVDSSDIDQSRCDDQAKASNDTEADDKSPKPEALDQPASKERTLPSWVWVHCGSEYVTTEDDVRCYLAVVCTPRSGERVGCPAVAETVREVYKQPDGIPYKQRHLQCTEPAVDSS